jgi:itaconate CoA-transferase
VTPSSLDSASSAGPLSGITVVSIEQAVAAPFATRQLADLGARVIKVERPGGGDFARGYDRTVKGLASYFVWLNRGKESLTLDLKDAVAADVLDQLLLRADVFVQNLAPGATARMGLSADRLRQRDPRLVVCDVSGYGSSGPFSDRRAYDLLVQCETGLLSVTGTPEQPAKVGISVADIAGGMYAFSGVLTALFARGRTGEGASLEISLFDALSEWMSQPMYYAMYTGVPPERTGTSHATIAPYGTFRTGDGAVQLAVQNEREWARLCTQVLDRPALLEDPRFGSNADRVAHRAELTAEIERALGGLDANETLQLLDKANIANGSFNTVLELLDHPQLREAGRWAPIDSPVGQLQALRPPTRISGFNASIGSIPELGEHTAAILSEFGFDRAQTEAWRARGAV